MTRGQDAVGYNDPRLLVNILGGIDVNKTRFLGYCDRALDGDRLSVVVRRADREIYPCVFLRGEWGKSLEKVYATEVTLFTPQWRKDDFRTWTDTCNERAKKFIRWLEEWKALRS